MIRSGASTPGLPPSALPRAGAGAGATPTFRIQAQGDRLRIIILGGFVLFVFWAGVVVGMGFSHGHVAGGLPTGLEVLRLSRPNGGGQQLRTAPPPPQLEDGSIEVCCGNALLVKCLACQDSVSELDYCLVRNPSLPDCAARQLVPSTAARLSGLGHTLYHTDANVFSADTLTLSAWILLDEAGAPQQIQTVLANRESGCDKDDRHLGFALFVNTWDTADRTLNLQWRSDANACELVSTAAMQVPYGKWTHVGAILSPTSAELYINGQRVAHRELAESSSSRMLAYTARPVYVGSHSAGRELHAFKGHIAHFAVQPGRNQVLATSSSAGWASVLSPGIKRVQLHPEPTPEEPIDFLIPLPQDLTLVVTGAWPAADFVLSDEMRLHSDAQARQRREVVRAAMKHAYGGYEQRAFGADEVMPRSGSPKTNWGGMAMTLVDSLDTLWIMNMKDEFYRARDYTRDKMRFDHISGSISTFETTIRHLGGLMSAYDLSGDQAFLDRAVDLGNGLAKAFQATASGLPINNVFINRATPRQTSSGNAVIAEVGTLQLEFRSLAYHSKQKKFAEMAEHVHHKMREQPPKHGLWPMNVNLNTGHAAGGLVTFGAMGDSFFEYLVKVWIQGGKVEKEYMDDYERAMDGMHEYIVQRSTPSGLVYLGDMQSYGGGMHHKMDHLACFVPAMLVLGVKHRKGAEHATVNARDLVIAKALLYTCVQMYERQATGIAPEFVDFVPGRDMVVPGSAPFYILRPETVESLYYLHQLTGHPVYRDWGHRIMMKIERHCKLPYGYGALPDVRDAKRQPDDRMESFFLAETLKYLFLLQDPDSEINLDEYVFNTEAHPLKVFPKGWRKEIGLA